MGMEEVIMMRKASTLTASLVILQTILLLVSVSIHVDASVVTITLATARDYRGWGSGSTDITLIIPVKGINVQVRVSFQGGDAYYAIAAALVANYDYQRGKYTSFSGGYTTAKKDYTGVLGWDSYTWSLITSIVDAKITPSCPQGQSFTQYPTLLLRLLNQNIAHGGVCRVLPV